MRKKNLIQAFNVVIFLFAMALSVGCLSSGKILITRVPGQTFDKEGRICFESKSPDIGGFQDELEHRLLKAGFQVRPQFFIKEKNEYVKKAKAGKSLEKDYILEYRYQTNRALITGNPVIESFEGNILSLDNGKKIGASGFTVGSI